MSDAATGNIRRPTVLLAGMVTGAVGVTMLVEVGDTSQIALNAREL